MTGDQNKSRGEPSSLIARKGLKEAVQHNAFFLSVIDAHRSRANTKIAILDILEICMQKPRGEPQADSSDCGVVPGIKKAGGNNVGRP